MGRKRPPKVTGVALIDKPSGQTSHDVVQTIRRAVGQSQVGHTGTLDPAATGLMVLTLGRGTRIGRFLEASDKAYVGTVRLGTSTTTGDAEGTVLASSELPEGGFDPARVREVLRDLVGPFEQQVPAYSAIKVDGERLHVRARRGEVVVGPTRPVVVHSLELDSLAGGDLVVRTRVSKGTYIRSLAVELGVRLGLPAHLASLRRISVGPHLVDRAVPPERFEAPDPPLLTLGEALRHIPAMSLTPRQVWDVAHGRAISTDAEVDALEPHVRLLDPDGRLTAVAHRSSKNEGQLEFDVVLVRPEDVVGTV